MAAPDMSQALMGEEMNMGPDMGLGDDEAAEGSGMFDEGEGLELGAGDESELDELFAADAQALFPDFDDDQLLNLQKLIDARIDAKYGPEMGAGAPEEPLL